jgi:hypothetical protein
MPSLKDSLRTNLEGFVPAAPALSLPPIATLPGQSNNFKANPSIRCPLPPFNAGPDTLRQFDQGDGDSPKRRVIPLPVQSQIGTGSIIQNVSVISSASSGGGTATAGLTARTVIYTSPVLAPGASDAVALTMAKSFQLIFADANTRCEMRLYGSALGQAVDSGRAIDSPVAAEVFNDLITDLVLDTAPYDWSWQNRVGVNTDLPQSARAFITVWNTDTVDAQITIALVFLPLEG